MKECIVIEGGVGEIVEKKSRFIATVKSVTTEEEALLFINEMKKKYWDARHNCMAYIVGGAKRFSDDGEPSGTAGKPMLDVLEGRNLDNIVVVVTRYFGGILLGTGGLVRAYQAATIEGINNSKIAEKQTGYEFDILTDYTDYGKIQYIAATEDVDIVDTEFAEAVKLKIVSVEEKADAIINKITEATSARAKFSAKKKIDFYKLEGEVLKI